ncbi:MAG: hypothetical protein QW327_00855 [Candidatus Odinarchaeota archaeon]
MTDKHSFTEKISEDLTSIINDLLENFKTLLKEEFEKVIGNVKDELNQIIEKYNENLEGNFSKIAETQDYLKNRLDELYNNSENTVRNLEKTINAVLTDNMDSRFKTFHEEMEKIIDMNAALTVELSNRLDTMLEKVTGLSKIEVNQQEMINELDRKIKTQVDKASTVFDSRLDGLNKQIEDKIIPNTSLIKDMQDKLSELSKMVEALDSKLAALKNISKTHGEKENTSEG